MKTLWKQGGSSNAPASPPATAKKGQKRGEKCQKSPLEANFTKQKEKHFKSCKAENAPKW